MPVLVYGLDGRSLFAGVQRVKTSLGSISKKALSVGASLGKMFNPLNVAIAGLGTGFGASKLIQIGDDYTNMGAQLEYLTGSSAEATEAQSALYEMSQKTGTSMQSNAKAFTRFALAQEMTGLSSAQSVEVLGSINTLLAKTGVSSSEASAGMIQLGQALASGKLQGDEFRSISENMPALMNEMAKSLGVTRHELKLMSTEGELTSQVVAKAFLDMSSSAGTTADELPLTVGRMWTRVTNAFEKMWVAINNETGILAWLAEALDDLVYWVENNTPAIVQFFVDMKDKAIEAWPDIKDFFLGLWDYGKAVWDLFELVWPMMDKGLRLLVKSVRASLPYIKSIIKWVTKAIEKLAAFGKYTAPAGYFRAAQEIASGGGLLEAGKAFFDVNRGDEKDADKQTSGERVLNMYISEKQSRSDIVNTANELERQGARS